MVARFTFDRLAESARLSRREAMAAQPPTRSATAKRLYVPVTRKVSPDFWKKGSQTQSGCGFQPVSSLPKTIPPLKANLVKAKLVFGLSLFRFFASLWKIPPCRWRGLRPPRGFSHRQAAGGFGFDSAVDLGTSPHGLSADRPHAFSNLAGRSDCAPPAKPVLILFGGAL